MTIADEIVSEIAEKLQTRGEPPQFYFSAKPNFISARLLALPIPDRKRALEQAAVFAYFLAKERNSPEAGFALLSVLDEVAKKTEVGRAP